MSKVNFTFDESEDRADINVIVNRHKLMNALFELSCYRRNLYKGYEDNAVMASGDKIIGKITEEVPEEYNDKPVKVYIEDEAILNELDRILGPVNDILDDY